ncbi:MAG: sporulation integral membrane protein YtvI [Bacillota bacterium]|jgi:sporulation integral membrane protein YtvI
MSQIPEKQLKDLIAIIKILLVLGIVYLAYYHILPALLAILAFLWPLMLPFIIGFLLAALFDPLVTFVVNKCRLPRVIGVLITMIATVGGFLAVIIWMIVRAVLELSKFSRSLPYYFQILLDWLEEIFREAQVFYFSLNLPSNWQQNAQSYLEKATANLFSALDWSFGFMTAVPNVILIIFFALISSFFISKDKELIKKTLYLVLPEKAARIAHRSGVQTGAAILGYLRAQIVLMLITMAQTLLGLYILGVDYVLLITLFVGILDILPILGPGLIFVPWIIVLLFSSRVKLALALLILYAIISVVRQVIQPKILGVSIGIHPLEALISLYVGYKVFGILGVIIGPILLVVLKGLWQSNFNWK